MCGCLRSGAAGATREARIVYRREIEASRGRQDDLAPLHPDSNSFLLSHINGTFFFIPYSPNSANLPPPYARTLFLRLPFSKRPVTFSQKFFLSHPAIFFYSLNKVESVFSLSSLHSTTASLLPSSSLTLWTSALQQSELYSYFYTISYEFPFFSSSYVLLFFGTIWGTYSAFLKGNYNRNFPTIETSLGFICNFIGTERTSAPLHCYLVMFISSLLALKF